MVFYSSKNVIYGHIQNILELFFLNLFNDALSTF